MTTTLIMLLPALFVFSVMLYIHIKEKQLDKEILKCEREQGRKKSSKELCEDLKDYHLKKSR
jgi:hypothetical protein